MTKRFLSKKKKEAYKLVRQGRAIFYRLNYLIWERISQDRINIYCYDPTFNGYVLFQENVEENPESLDFWFTEACGQT